MTRPRRKAGYRRISDEDSQGKGTSLSDQLDEIKLAVARDNGVLKEEHIFTDNLSGNGKYWRDRDGIQGMLACAKRHEFDDLYISCLDRFGRDVIIQEFLIQELKHYGVTVISLKSDEPTDRDDMMSQMARWFWGRMAQEELKKIKERTQRGIKGRVVKKHALLPGSRPLYGFRWRDKQMEWQGETITVPKALYVIYEEEIKIVKACFQWCRLRMSVRKIAKMLTDMGIPTPNGKKIWRPTSVYNILTQEAYTGKHYAFKRKFEYISGEGMHREFRNKEEWVEIDGSCIPQVIDTATFEEVQNILMKNKLESTRHNGNPEDTLCRSGYAVCGYCLSNLAVQRLHTKNIIDYACYKHKQGYNECRGVSVRAYLVDKIAWMKAVEIIRNPCIIEREIEKQRVDDPTKGSIKAAEELLTKTVLAVINLTKSLETTSDPTTQAIIMGRLEELAHLKAGYEEQYDQILRFRINWEDAMRALDEFKAWCSEIRPQLDEEDFTPSYKQKRDALEMIGIKVVVFKEDHNPRFRVEVSPPNIMSKFRPIVSKSASAF